jgi:glycosyltransferase involved in cell wall biosynthesis
MSPKVSLIVPNYNYARYLDERITSLLDQTFGDFELIIVDDASTDGSRHVIDGYRRDPRVRTRWFDVNSGRTYQRWNDGASMARGAYLMFAGADDSCAPTLLETLVRTLEAHPDVGVVYSRAWMIDTEGQRLRLKPRGERWSRDFIASAAEEIPVLLKGGGVLTASAALLRRSVFERCGGWDATLQLYADWLLWARVLQGSKLAYVAEPLTYFRAHGESVGATTSSGRAILERYRVVDFVLRTFPLPRHIQEETRQQLAYLWVAHLRRNGTCTDIGTALQTYRIARTVDPRLHHRIGRMVVDRICGSGKKKRRRSAI